MIYQLTVTELSTAHHSSQNVAFGSFLLGLLLSNLLPLLVKDVGKEVSQILDLFGENGICVARNALHKPLW